MLLLGLCSPCTPPPPHTHIPSAQIIVAAGPRPPSPLATKPITQTAAQALTQAIPQAFSSPVTHTLPAPGTKNNPQAAAQAVAQAHPQAFAQAVAQAPHPKPKGPPASTQAEPALPAVMGLVASVDCASADGRLEQHFPLGWGLHAPTALLLEARRGGLMGGRLQPQVPPAD